MVAMNAMKGMSPPGGGGAPGAMVQGGAGAANAPQPPGMDSQAGRAPTSVPPPGLN
jgi:hypothetical protein